MQVPLPCKLGNSICVDGKENELKAVTWFYWSWQGWEFTYVIGDELATNLGINEPFMMNVADDIIRSDLLAKLGYPLKGIGRTFGISCRQNKLYADVIVESGYYQHILCECDEQGRYKENGAILFPPCPSYDSEDKRRVAVLKKYQKAPIGVITR